jgi:hypothetical protein
MSVLLVSLHIIFTVVLVILVALFFDTLFFGWGEILVIRFFCWGTTWLSCVVLFLVDAGEDMLIDLILDDENVNPMLLCNPQWFIQKSTTVTRTPNVGVYSTGSSPKVVDDVKREYTQCKLVDEVI